MATVVRGLIQRGDLALFDGRTTVATRTDATGGTLTGLVVGDYVDVAQVYGGGTSLTSTTIAAAVARVGSATVCLSFVPGTWTITANTTIPSNISCHVPAGCVFSISSGITLTINGQVIAGAYQIFSGDGSASLANSQIPVEWFGAAGNGSTDSTTALRNAASAMGVGSSLHFGGAGVYMVNSDEVNGVLFSNKSNFAVYGNNATIKVINSESVAGNHEVVYFNNCTDGYIENLIVDANRANRTPAEVGAHNIVIADGARLKFNKVRAINAVCDGWYITAVTEGTESTYPTDITLEDCDGDNAYRNNLSCIGSKRVTIIRGRYTGATGTAPQSGVDIEPDPTTTYGNEEVRIIDVECSDNVGYGCQITRSGGAVINDQPYIRGLKGSNNTAGLLYADAYTDLVVDGVNCGPHSAATRGLVDLGSAGATNASLKNLEFHQITASDAANAGLYIHSSVTGRVTVDGLKANTIDCSVLLCNRRASISNVDIYDCNKDPAISVAGGTHSVLRRITIDDCTGRAIYNSVADTEIDGVTVINAASTTAAIQFDTGSTRPVVRNVSVYQTTSVPVGSVAVYFATAPKWVSNVQAFSAGTDYTAANIFTFAAGLSGAKVFDCSPHPFEASVTWDPASVADGDSSNQTVTVTGVAVGEGWYVDVSPGIAPQGMSVDATVDATDTVRIVVNNNTGGAIDLASSSWKVYCEKR